MQQESGIQSQVSFLWKILFFSIIGGYCLYYAPFGLNETDGGFLSGLAWQVLNGKILYQDLVYVRPPLPVWLRALELQVLPDQFAVLGERWIFYGKLALYSWLGASILAKGAKRWTLATFGFIISAHGYPPMAWHTVDGILFGVLAAYFSVRGRKAELLLGGICLCAAMLCKQSFYPLLPIFAVFWWLKRETNANKAGWFWGGFGLAVGLFFFYLAQNNLISSFLNMTSGAASGGQAIQHGLLDYFRITPELAIPGLFLLSPVFWWFQTGQKHRFAMIAWWIWLLALPLSYGAITWLRQDHTVPFAQSRAMFWIALAIFLAPLLKNRSPILHSFYHSLRENAHFLLLLGISWSASVSWGYNLPILFSTPWVWAGMEVTRRLIETGNPIRFAPYSAFLMLLILLLSFRISHEFVYRDGRRSEMTESMGSIFPKLSGIYSDPETAELYQDLKQLANRYGPNFKTLPAFPQANFLCGAPPPLPLDWVVNRETNGDNTMVYHSLEKIRPVIFLQKAFRAKIESDPELEVSRRIFEQYKLVAESPHFWIFKNEGQ